MANSCPCTDGTADARPRRSWPPAGLAIGLLGIGLLTSSPLQAREPDRFDYEMHDRAASAFRALPEDELKSRFLQCEGSVMRTSLGWNDVALCSIAYQVLLERAFGGDFLALLAWWRSQPRHEDEASFPTDERLENR